MAAFDRLGLLTACPLKRGWIDCSSRPEVAVLGQRCNHGLLVCDWSACDLEDCSSGLRIALQWCFTGTYGGRIVTLSLVDALEEDRGVVSDRSGRFGYLLN